MRSHKVVCDEGTLIVSADTKRLIPSVHHRTADDWDDDQDHLSAKQESSPPPPPPEVSGTVDGPAVTKRCLSY